MLALTSCDGSLTADVRHKIMNPLPAVAVLACLLLTSCSSPLRDVSLAKLDDRLKADTENQSERSGRPSYSWLYIGSDAEHHYFHRQVGRSLYSEFSDGIYRIRREELDLTGSEFTRVATSELTQSLPAFTHRNQHGIPIEYGIRFGVEKRK